MTQNKLIENRYNRACLVYISNVGNHYYYLLWEKGYRQAVIMFDWLITVAKVRPWMGFLSKEYLTRISYFIQISILCIYSSYFFSILFLLILEVSAPLALVLCWRYDGCGNQCCQSIYCFLLFDVLLQAVHIHHMQGRLEHGVS